MSCNLILTFFFFFNDTATTEIYTLSLHDALPILWLPGRSPLLFGPSARQCVRQAVVAFVAGMLKDRSHGLFEERSEEHTSELQSRSDLVCRLLLEKKK